VGESATIHCYSDQPAKWARHNNDPLNAGIQYQNSLVMKELTHEDSGMYTCYGVGDGVGFEASAEILVGGIKLYIGLWESTYLFL